MASDTQRLLYPVAAFSGGCHDDDVRFLYGQTRTSVIAGDVGSRTGRFHGNDRNISGHFNIRSESIFKFFVSGLRFEPVHIRHGVHSKCRYFDSNYLVFSIFVKLALYMFIACYGTAQIFHLKDWRKVALVLAPISFIIAVSVKNIQTFTHYYYIFL